MKTTFLRFAVLAALVTICGHGIAKAQLPADSDQKLSADFWAWRARYGQYTNDDVTRIERPVGVHRDWSAPAVAQQLKQLAAFDARWKKLDNKTLPVPEQVDHRLLGSALARVHWELERLCSWQRDPNFYLEQTLSPVGEALTVPAPYDEQQSREILLRLNNIPSILEQAKENLRQPPAPFAQMAIDSLAGIRDKLLTLAATLPPQTTINATEWHASAERAATALEAYRAWLERRLPGLPATTAIGRGNYIWFLRNVALMPFTPEELVARGEQEFDRAVAFEAFEVNRNRAVPPLTMAATLDELIARNRASEQSVREFLAKKNIRTLPEWLQHYTLRAIPPYLAALGAFLETDDFTSPSRLDQDGIRYSTLPSPNAGYFATAAAKDPRVQIVHEGTVGHYGQLCASWKNPDPIRRYYYDSGPIEGLGFYAEEMMLQAGLYDDSPHTREIVYNQMRLRAIRMIVDVKVALGEFTTRQAIDYLAKNVPLPVADAHQEVVEMIEQPGQKITYQAGKLQILELVKDARLRQGDKFDLQQLHNFMWLNGNVPIALLRWEYLGSDEEIRKLSSPD